MPEGDTVGKLAGYLGPALSGRRLVAGWARTTPPADLAGRRVERLFARGKHLFIDLDREQCLRSHLGMWGSWHAYAPGEPWRKPRRQGAIVLDTGERVFVCFNPLQVEMLNRGGVRRRVLEAALGPDLMDEPLDAGLILRRAESFAAADTPVLDLLLDQRVACGIGNVYKSEVLFLERVHPLTPWRDLAETRLLDLYRLASRLLRANSKSGPRVTRPAADGAGRLWVYRRSGQPCLRCGARVQRAKLGRDLRSTYWCPGCQPVPCEPDAGRAD